MKKIKSVIPLVIKVAAVSNSTPSGTLTRLFVG